MLRYVVRRLVLLLPVVVGITALVFLILHVAPGDPVHVLLGQEYTKEAAAELRRQLGLDRPVAVQYLLWLGRVLRGELGRDMITGEQVTNQLAARLPTTLLLSVTSMFVALAIGLPAGIASARHRGGWVDHVSRVLAIVGVSIPVFWLGMLLIVLFSLKFQWFPPGGSLRDYGPVALVLPSLALGSTFAALIARITRTALLDVLGLDYIRTARAKGLDEAAVLYRHALRNSLIPIVTVLGLQIGNLLSGALLTETVFSLPGLGRLIVDSVLQRDYPLLQGCVLVTSLVFVLVNLLVDMLYAYLDPRIVYA